MAKWFVYTAVLVVIAWTGVNLYIATGLSLTALYILIT